MASVQSKISFKMAAVFAVLLLVVLCIHSHQALADELIDVDRSVSVELTYTDDTTAAPIEGATFSLYRVAGVSTTGLYTLEEPFASSSVTFNTTQYETSATDDDWNTLASSYASWVTAQNANQANSVTPVATATIDASGTAQLQPSNGADLKPGLYLLCGTTVTLTDSDGAKTTYTPAASMLLLPALDTTTDTWDYSVEVEPKKTSETVAAARLILSSVVLWDDAGFESERPSEVTLVLYRDGVEFKRQVVYASDGWRYNAWGPYDKGHTYTWALIEDPVPTNYTASVTYREATSEEKTEAFNRLNVAFSGSPFHLMAEGDSPSVDDHYGVFVVLNTRNASSDATDDNTGSGDVETTTGSDKLPKTSDSALIALILCGVGLLFLMFALFARRRNNNDKSAGRNFG